MKNSEREKSMNTLMEGFHIMRVFGEFSSDWRAYKNKRDIQKGLNKKTIPKLLEEMEKRYTELEKKKPWLITWLDKMNEDMEQLIKDN